MSIPPGADVPVAVVLALAGAVSLVASQAKTARVRLSELGKNGKLLRRVTLVVSTGRMQLVRIPYSSGTRSLRIAVVS